MLKKLYLIDNKTELVQAWQQAFKNYDEVEAIQGDFFSKKADAMVSPANSFGFMDGGLDLAIRNMLGFDVVTKVQNEILDKFYGELPIGSAVTVETDHKDWPFLIAAPTMRIPENVAHTMNAYFAFRAVLNAVNEHNRTSDKKIESVLCPGLATGIGMMPARRCAGHMRAAYSMYSKPARIGSYDQVHEVHRKLNIVG